jgi:hypothetical protein
MNITELDSYNLADAVKFNDKLNPVIWQGQHMRPEVRDQLLTIAEDFREHLGLANIDVKDITVLGSNAGYTYTPHSDIDLHLVVRMPHADNEVYRELFDAKKYQYNDTHNITIGGYEVELYVEDADKPAVSQGVFSVLNNDWVHIPRQRPATVNDNAVRSKYNDLKHRIDSAVAGKNLTKISQLIDKIKRMRLAGLAQNGELGGENLAYKMLRTQGDISRLHDARNAAHDEELSLVESTIMSKPRMTYGFNSKKKLAEVEITPDGVSPSTKMFLSETDDESILRDFVAFCAKELELETEPQIRLRRDPAWSARNRTFGRYDHDTNQLEISIGNRHIMDVLRTCAHELTHQRQGETQTIAPDSGHTGSPEENEANAAAGIIMRRYGAMHPELFEKSTVAEASGYIPTTAEMHDPRFEMAITQDVRPGAIGRAANAFLLNTDAQGHPQELRPDGLVKRLAEQLAAFKRPLSEAEQLDEINMGGKSLRKLSKSVDARAGIEFEMIVPNVEGGEYDFQPEPDYDNYNETARDIDGIIEFFDDRDFNGARAIRELRTELESNYLDWRETKIYEDWTDNGFDFFAEWVANNIDPEEIIAYLDKDSDYNITKDDILNYSNYLWEEAGESRDEALEEFRDEKKDDGEYDEEQWLRSEGIRDMQDVESAYSTRITWPHWTEDDGMGDGTYSIEAVAESFEKAIGRPVMWGDDYHNIDRDDAYSQGAYIVEPDGSLEANSGNDRGLEFISPPLPLDELAKDMQKVKKWADSNGCYTSKANKTGLHINVSVPGLDAEMKNLDLVKLALLLGDNYVAKEFGRLGNTYAKSVYNIVMNNIKNRPETAEVLLDRMRENLSKAATRVIHNAQTDKYSSINVKNGYIEFRSPGGDWLDANFDKIQTTLERFVVATDAAVDPAKYRQEYLKKLYRALSGTEIEHGRNPATGKKTFKIATEADFANLLSEYMAGKINREELTRIAAEQRQLGQDKPKDKQQYRMVNPDTYQEYARFTATSAEKADAQAKLYAAENDIAFYNYIVLDSGMQVVGGDIRHTATPGRQSDPNGRYEIINRATGAEARPRFMFSAVPQQIPYVLQAWANRNGTAPTDWTVIDTESGIEVNSTTPTTVGASRVEPLWTVSLLDNMARYVEVRAPNELSALAAAHETDPTNFPMTVTTDDVIITPRAQQLPTPRPIPGVEDVPLDLEFAQRTVPGSTIDLAQQRATPGTFTGAWKVVDSNTGEELHRFSGIGNSQEDANRVAGQWVRSNSIAVPTEVYPIMSESVTESFINALIKLDQEPWALTESTNNFEIKKSSLFDKTVQNKSEQLPDLANKIQEFLKFKMVTPGQPWGNDSPFIAAGPLGSAIPKLRHAHLTRDLSLYYTIEGRNPTVIKLYGVFNHHESGTGTPKNINKQKNLARQLVNQEVAETKNPNTTYKLWSAPVKIKQPTYTGYIDVAVTAQNAHLARQLMKAQYGVADWEIGSVKEVKV